MRSVRDRASGREEGGWRVNHQTKIGMVRLPRLRTPSIRVLTVTAALVASALVISFVVESATRPDRATLTSTSGVPFSPQSVFNVVIPANPVVDPGGEQVVPALADGVVANLYASGTPVYTVDRPITGVPIICTATWGTCDVANDDVPIPANFQPNSDGVTSIVDLNNRTVYDLWQARRQPNGSWEASWATKSSLDGSGLDAVGATPAGFSALAGLVRTFEISSGSIDHALVFTSSLVCKNTMRYPATHTDGFGLPTAPCIPEGARVQLDPSIDVAAIPGITPGEVAVARALQIYGGYCRGDGGATMAINFEAPTDQPDPYPQAGFDSDYDKMPHIPWNKLQVLRSWDGT